MLNSRTRVPFLRSHRRCTVVDAASRASHLRLAAAPTRLSSVSTAPWLPERFVADDSCTLSFLLQPSCGSKPDEYALSRALKTAATEFRSPDRARKAVQGFIVKLGYGRFTVLMTAMVDLAVKHCGDLREASKLFDELTERDVVSWTSMIVGYAQRGHYQDSLDLFRRMVSANTAAPNSYSFSGALSACSGLGALRQGREIHAHLFKASADGGLDPVLQNSLLNVYSRCKDLGSSQKLFDTMSERDVIAWNAMILGYLECGLGEDALRLFEDMVSHGRKPDRFTYATCVDACGYLASLRQGIQIHTSIVKIGFHSDLVVSNALVDMYAKCGSIDSAKLIFAASSSRDIMLWTTMIAAYAKSGSVKEAISTFEQMMEMKLQPDKVTFLAVLSACSHGGLVSEGWHYFRLMTEVHAMSAKLEHYSCMVDLLCRSGHLEDALHFIKHIPCKPSISMWTTFLNSCRLQGNILLACDARQFLEMDTKNHINLVALSNAYAAQSYWKETWEIRGRMKGDCVKKEPGCSWAEIGDGFHVFPTEGRSHPEMEEILQTLHGLCLSVREN